MGTFIVALKRQSKEAFQGDLKAILRSIEGVSIVGEPANLSRVQIHATAEGIRRVRETVGSACLIEPVVTRYHS